MNFITLFPECENVHLVKDVGMIPYILHKKYGYSSKIVSYNNSPTYNYLENEVKGLKVEFIQNTGCSTKDGIKYLIKNARKIDVLHIFHVNTKRNFYWIFIYKLLNPRGKVFLKLDADNRIKEFDYHKKGIKGFIKRYIIKKCTLISIETERLHKFINNSWGIDVEYIPNGFYDNDLRESVSYEEKENIICTVGRIGTHQKATEVLLEGFKLASDEIQDWKLKIIGPIDEGFNSIIENFNKENPDLIERIIFTGSINDREKLDAEYKKAKIFCLTSRYEGFALVFLEAIKSGCYIVTSNVECAGDATNEGEYGDIFPIDNPYELARCFTKICNQENKIKENCPTVQEYAYEKFYWPTICSKIDELLKYKVK